MTATQVKHQEHDRWLFYSLIGLILFLPLPLGSNRAWAWSIAEVWIFINMAYWLFTYVRGQAKIPTYWKQCLLPIYLLTGFSVVILIQLLPVYPTPAKSTELLNQLGWSSISLDPHATWVHWLKTVAYTCLCAQTLLLVYTEKRLKIVLPVSYTHLTLPTTPYV